MGGAAADLANGIVVVVVVAGACLVATGSHAGATRPEDLCNCAGRLVLIVLSTLPGAGAGETKDEVGLETELSKSSMAVGADAVAGGADSSSGAVAVVGDGTAVGEVGTVGEAEAVGDVGATDAAVAARTGGGGEKSSLVTRTSVAGTGDDTAANRSG